MKLITHKHHIIPRHIGGTDDPNNIIKLTIEEHAEAHRILYETHRRMEDYFAWKGLSGQIGKDEILTELAKLQKGKKRSKEFCEKQSKMRKGHIVSEETKRKIGNANRGKKLTPEHIAKTRRIGIPQTEYQKQTIRQLRQKTYNLTDPSGNKFTITNLSKFCRENSLDQGNMHKGKIKGWTCEKVL
jgi:hypothetical protein